MTDPRVVFDELRERASVLRELAADRATSWGLVAALEIAQESLLEATAHLTSFIARGLDEPSYFDDLAAARKAVEATAAALPAERSEEHEELVEVLAELDAIREAALGLVVRHSPDALRGVARVATPARSLEFVASRGVPSDHHFPVDRAVLLDAAETDGDGDDTDEEEDDADDDEAAALAELASLGAKVPSPRTAAAPRRSRPKAHDSTAETRMLQALGRSGLEDLAGLSALCWTPDDSPWGERARFERRLGEALDALVALAVPCAPGVPPWDLVRAARAYATEWAVPDVGRAFAFAFPLCCGRDPAALDSVLLALRRAHPRTHPAFLRALSLGTHPGIDGAISAMLDGAVPDEGLLVALGVAARRRIAVSPALIVLAAHPDERVACAALEVCVARGDDAARAAIAAAVGGDAPLRVLLAAARSAARLGDTSGIALVRGRLRSWVTDEPLLARDAVALLAAVGDRRDEATLTDVFAQLPRTARWLGHFGAAAHVPLLIEHLRTSNDPEERADASSALHRITGLGFAVAALEDGLPADGLVGRRVPPGPEHDRIGADAPSWQAAWTRAAGSLGAAKVRLRHGRAFAPAAVVEELADPSTLQGVRRHLLFELDVALRRPFPVDLDDWFDRQQAALRVADANPA